MSLPFFIFFGNEVFYVHYSVTTDVQLVVAKTTNKYMYMIKCLFINGSDARGCMVVLVSNDSGIGNVSHSFIKNSTSAQLTQGQLILSQPVSCYHQIFGFDIEVDNTTSDVAIEGNLTVLHSTICSKTKGCTSSQLSFNNTFLLYP